MFNPLGTATANCMIFTNWRSNNVRLSSAVGVGCTTVPRYDEEACQRPAWWLDEYDGFVVNRAASYTPRLSHSAGFSGQPSLSSYILSLCQRQVLSRAYQWRRERCHVYRHCLHCDWTLTNRPLTLTSTTPLPLHVINCMLSLCSF